MRTKVAMHLNEETHYRIETETGEYTIVYGYENARVWFDEFKKIYPTKEISFYEINVKKINLS